MLFVIRHRFSGPALVFEEEWMIKLSTGGGSTLRKRGKKNRQRKELHEDPVPNGSEGVSARFPCVCVSCVRCVVLSAVCGLQVSHSLSVSLSLSLTLGCTL